MSANVRSGQFKDIRIIQAASLYQLSTVRCAFRKKELNHHSRSEKTSQANKMSGFTSEQSERLHKQGFRGWVKSGFAA